MDRVRNVVVLVAVAFLPAVAVLVSLRVVQRVVVALVEAVVLARLQAAVALQAVVAQRHPRLVVTAALLMLAVVTLALVLDVGPERALDAVELPMVAVPQQLMAAVILLPLLLVVVDRVQFLLFLFLVVVVLLRVLVVGLPYLTTTLTTLCALGAFHKLQLIST